MEVVPCETIPFSEYVRPEGGWEDRDSTSGRRRAGTAISTRGDEIRQSAHRKRWSDQLVGMATGKSEVQVERGM